MLARESEETRGFSIFPWRHRLLDAGDMPISLFILFFSSFDENLVLIVPDHLCTAGLPLQGHRLSSSLNEPSIYRHLSEIDGREV